MTWLYQSPAIQFDANFESGNLASAERVNEYEYDLFIQPDISTSTRMWFYFRCQQVPLNQPVLFNIVGINKNNTTFSSLQRIIVRSSTRSKWQRLPTAQQFYTFSSKHRCYSTYPILSFVFQFDQQEEYFFAFGYPYTYSMLSKFISRIKDHNLPFVQIESIGKTHQDRDISMITIGKPSVFSKYFNDKKPQQIHTVFISARCHAGEFPGSYICHGILEYMLSNNPKAKFLRNNVQFKIVPMINPDGVFSGYYRTNSHGYDLNRNYYEPIQQTIECSIIKSQFEDLVGFERPENLSSFDYSHLNLTLLELANLNHIGQPVLATESSEDSTSRPTDSRAETPKKLPTLGQLANLPKAPQKSAKTDTRVSYDQLIQQVEPQVPLHKTHLDFVIDLHSHSNTAGGFLFLNPDSYIFNRQKRSRTEQVFPQLLAKKCACFGSLQSSFKESQNIREGSLRRAFCNLGKQKLADDCPYIYCLEVSNSHGPDPAESGKKQLKMKEGEESDNDEEMDDDSEGMVSYTPEKYMMIGERVCDTLYEIYSKLFK
uniref:Cytosolic carboxypeptidase 6 n=1 Tax=Trepomonas sp. PC1 TaxID=1076344 RepID=A0A146KCA2_9EUKA|eukprot:JAP94393.1 Cytosolic carboxypeptidase 6 [Trepomonas sp. PC1]